MKWLALVSALSLFPAAAGAQNTADSRWNTWLGCWELVLESSREPETAPDLVQREVTPQRDPAPRGQVCVRPAPNGATFTTSVDAQAPLEQTVIADGADHPITDKDCRGAQRSEWSQNGLILFARATLTCARGKGDRLVSGLSIVGPGDTWLDIQAAQIDEQENVRVRRYRRVEPRSRGTRTRSRSLSLDEVQEASGKVSAGALEAALVETNSTFNLTGKRLVALQDAGVPSSVIDLMVALSYPEQFVVERSARADRFEGPYDRDPFGGGWAFGPTWSTHYGFDPFYDYYSPYYYSPFTYSYLGGGTSFIVIEDGGLRPPSRPSGGGRVVDGLGYTRVRPREAEGAFSGLAGRATSTASPGGFSSSDGSTASGGSSSSGSSSSSSGGSVSSQGFSSGNSSGSSSGSSSGDTGRTAQPR